MRDGPILIVDDEPIIRLTLAEILQIEGYKTEIAGNGAEALEAITRASPSLVLLDMNMPVLDGWGVARELRRLEIDVPIVVMTAGTSAQVTAREIGAAGYVAKPFDVTDLVAYIERLRDNPGGCPFRPSRAG